MRTSAAAKAYSDLARVVFLTSDQSTLPEIERVIAPVFETQLLDAADDILPLMSELPLDAIVLDLDTVAENHQSALDILSELRQIGQDLVLVAITRNKGRGLRLKAGEFGADEFFIAPLDFQELRMVLERALEKRSMEIENRRLREQIVAKYSFCDLIGGSEAMQRVYDAIQRVAQGNTTVIIRGESGSGKELAARAIVASGPRAHKPFISVNCAALPETLIETELFGHERGAFTDAKDARAGHIEMAHGGTLFLDEISTLPLPLQSKLLRVIEDRAVQRIGGKSARKIDFRLITATNDHLEDAVKAGEFREDLYYRVQVIPIFLPPLRERRGDIPLLVEHFLRLYCAANGVPPKHVDPEVMELFETHDWPGNVRELENLIQRLVLMTDQQTIQLRHLPQHLLVTSTTTQEAMLIPEQGIDFDQEIEKIEGAYLQAALHRTAGKKVTAAQLLRINSQRMKYLCRKHGL